VGKPQAGRLRALLRDPWFRVGVIVLAGAAAHGGCLGAVFYLDDLWQIQDSEYVEGGLWWGEPNNILTNLSYYLTWRLVGFSPIAFHFGNLVLHLLGALSVYWLARYLLTVNRESRPADWETVAWLGAMIFAVHPLCTEVTHYARARDHELVGFFSFLAAGWTALALRGKWLWGGAVLIVVLGAALSKGPGLPQALLSTAVVGLAFSTREHWRILFFNWRLLVTAICMIVGTIWLVSGHIRSLFSILIAQGNEQFGRHALTQCRVLPQYLWRMVLPLKLCSDHLVQTTLDLSDVPAWVCAAFVLGLIAGIIFAWIRGWKPWALILALGLGSLLLRWLYIVSETMVEYRTYPAMPFVALSLAGLICYWYQRQPRFAAASVCVLLGFFIVLAHQRSADWSSREALYAQILRLYPLQLRAMNGLSQDDLREQQYGPILDRHPEFLSRLEQALTFSETCPHRGYITWPLWFVVEECAVAEAIAHTKNPSSAREYHNLTAWKMNEAQIYQADLWSEWHLTAGRIALLEGDKTSALHEFVQARRHYRTPVPVDREIRKINPAYHSETESTRRSR
jgi:hypothetical protein